METTQSNESDSKMEEVNISDNFTQKHKELLSSWLDKLSFENENFQLKISNLQIAMLKATERVKLIHLVLLNH